MAPAGAAGMTGPSKAGEPAVDAALALVSIEYVRATLWGAARN